MLYWQQSGIGVALVRGNKAQVKPQLWLNLAAKIRNKNTVQTEVFAMITVHNLIELRPFEALGHMGKLLAVCEKSTEISWRVSQNNFIN